MHLRYKWSPLSISWGIPTKEVLGRIIRTHPRLVHVVEGVGWIKNVWLGHLSSGVHFQLLAPRDADEEYKKQYLLIIID